MLDEDPQDIDVDSFDDDDDLSPTSQCPECGADIYEDADQCPVCGDWVPHTIGPARLKWWWIVTGVLAAAMLLWWSIT